MEIDETARFELHEGLREVLGETRGDTLMSMLSPAAWSDVATKADLASLEDRIDERMGSRLARLEDRLTSAFHQEMNRQIWTMIGSLLALAAVLTANDLW